MTVETFRKSCEYMKANNQTDLIRATKENLSKNPDEERRKVFNEVFNEAPKKEEKEKREKSKNK